MLPGLPNLQNEEYLDAHIVTQKYGVWILICLPWDVWIAANCAALKEKLGGFVVVVIGIWFKR